MKDSFQELTPIELGDAGVKTLNIVIEAGYRCFRLHWHDRMEIIRINKGALSLDINGKDITVDQNEIYIIPPKTPHAGVAKADLDYDVIMFDVRSFYNGTPLSSKLLEPIFNGKARFNAKTSDKAVNNCFDKILQALKHDSFLTTSLMYRLFGLLYQNCLFSFDDSTKLDPIIASAVKYIEENYQYESISTESLSRQFGYSAAHFCRKFKAQTWLTPMNYLKIYRLEASAKLLKQGKYSINEVAALCGFSDSNYFTRCFKAHFSVPPTKYTG